MGVAVVKVLMLWIALLLLPGMAAAEQQPVAESAASAEAIMQQFAEDKGVSEQRRIDTQRKHEILFYMGIALLVLLLAAGSFGVAMVAFGRDVFVPHMILAGLSITLAIVHAVTATVWFWPY